MNIAQKLRRLASTEDGITLIIALLVMFVAGLLVVAAFTAADGDIQLSHDSTIQKQAVYASLAGVQEYQYHLEKEPDYWQTCEAPSSAVPENKYEHYEIRLLGANGNTSCSTAKPFETMIESSGAAANTFRIESIGCAGKQAITNCTTAEEAEKAKHTDNMQVRKVIASFKSTGFLQFVYFTRYEDEDPALYEPKADCETYYEVKGVKRSSECALIEFITGDGVKGAPVRVLRTRSN
jgi:Tfp pilus assembly protein PilX